MTESKGRFQATLENINGVTTKIEREAALDKETAIIYDSIRRGRVDPRLQAAESFQLASMYRHGLLKWPLCKNDWKTLNPAKAAIYKVQRRALRRRQEEILKEMDRYQPAGYVWRNPKRIPSAFSNRGKYKCSA